MRFNHIHLDPSFTHSLNAMIALSAVQSSAQTFIHNAILFMVGTITGSLALLASTEVSQWNYELSIICGKNS